MPVSLGLSYGKLILGGSPKTMATEYITLDPIMYRGHFVAASIIT